MASELSQLIESELRKAESANKPDEHQRRLASLRVKVGTVYWEQCTGRNSVLFLIGSAIKRCVQTGLDKPPPGPLQRLCTPKRQVIAAAVVTVLVLLLIVVVAVHRRHTLGQGRCTVI